MEASRRKRASVSLYTRVMGISDVCTMAQCATNRSAGPSIWAERLECESVNSNDDSKIEHGDQIVTTHGPNANG